MRGKRFVLLASAFHPSIGHALVQGATQALLRAGVSRAAIRVVWAPGAFELPAIAARLAKRRPRPDAIVAVGALIRGGTVQYDVIAHAVAQGLCQVAVEAAMPVTFGVIVAETLAQATARAGGAEGNRGEEAAESALVMLRLFNASETSL